MLIKSNKNLRHSFNIHDVGVGVIFGVTTVVEGVVTPGAGVGWAVAGLTEHVPISREISSTEISPW